MLSNNDHDRILLLDENVEDLAEVSESIVDQLPLAEVVAVESFSTYQRELKSSNFDIVVLDGFSLSQQGMHLLQELRLKDYEPSVLLIAASEYSEVVASALNSGCTRCIIKNEEWLDKIGPAVRSMLRQRKLENVNEALIAKLTEANMLLEQKNRRLDEFARTVAHDIRGPLGGISMKLEYMRDVYGDELDERFSKLIDSSLCSSRRLISVVQGMYQYAKLGTRSLNIEKVALPEFIEEVIIDLGFDDSVDLQVGLGELPEIWGDKVLLRKVFMNLIGNAVKYTDKESIIINVGFNRTINRSLADFAEIYVEDNGPGIAKDEQGEVFRMFSRGRSQNQETEGTGIGLAVVKRIIELHLGKIRLESEPGSGSRFYLSLPMDKISLEVD